MPRKRTPEQEALYKKHIEVEVIPDKYGPRAHMELDGRERAQLRWIHFGVIGRIEMAKAALQAAASAASVCEVDREKAHKLCGEVEILLANLKRRRTIK